MHRPTILTVVLGVTLAAGLATAHEGVPGFEAPLGKAKLAMGKQKVKFSGTWVGAQRAEDPSINTSLIQVTACGGTDTGKILLDRSMWKALKKDRGYVYKDKTGSVEGIRSLLIRNTKTGGKIKLKGRGSPVWTVSGDASRRSSPSPSTTTSGVP
jgi:hypothetical protein